MYSLILAMYLPFESFIYLFNFFSLLLLLSYYVKLMFMKIIHNQLEGADR